MSNKMSDAEREWPFQLEVSGGFLILASVTCFLWGGSDFAAACLAAAVHELGHLAVILAQKSSPRRLRLDFSGACLICGGRLPDLREELLRALAGPAAGLLLWGSLRASSSELLKRSAQMSLMLSLVNLLPAEGLDGGRVLRSILGSAEEAVSRRVTVVLSWAAAAAATVLGILRSPQLFLYGLWLSVRAARITGGH